MHHGKDGNCILYLVYGANGSSHWIVLCQLDQVSKIVPWPGGPKSYLVPISDNFPSHPASMDEMTKQFIYWHRHHPFQTSTCKREKGLVHSSSVVCSVWSFHSIIWSFYCCPRLLHFVCCKILYNFVYFGQCFESNSYTQLNSFKGKATDELALTLSLCND